MRIGVLLHGILALATVVVGGGCTAIEPERRPASTTYFQPGQYPGTGEPSRPVPTVTAVAPARDNPAPASAPAIYAASAILIDATTGRTLWEKNSDSRRQVASTQKLLTALLIAERGGLDRMVTIMPEDTRVEPAKLYVKAGEQYSRRSLLTTMMVKSCNDVANSLARDHSGSLSAFTDAMNQRAAQLGATSSYFANPSGLPANQFSTARDIARIAFVAYRNPTLRSMMRLTGYTFRYQSGRTKFLEATNKLLKKSPIFNGMKTGYTFAAGRCLVTSASMGGRSLILVQLGSKTSYIFDDAERMIQWGFSQTRPLGFH